MGPGFFTYARQVRWEFVFGLLLDLDFDLVMDFELKNLSKPKSMTKSKTKTEEARIEVRACTG